MSNDDDVMRMIARLDVLRVAMDRGTATPEDCRRYWRAVGEVEARLHVRADGPRRAVRRGAETEGMAA